MLSAYCVITATLETMEETQGKCARTYLPQVSTTPQRKVGKLGRLVMTASGLGPSLKAGFLATSFFLCTKKVPMGNVSTFIYLNMTAEKYKQMRKECVAFMGLEDQEVLDVGNCI